MLRNYLKMAVKVLLRHKLFTGISLFGITSTLIVLVLAMAFVDQVLGPVYPEARQARILTPWSRMVASDGRSRGPVLDPRFFERHLRALPGVERLSLFGDPRPMRSYREGARVNWELKHVDADFWRILSFGFVEGGPFGDDDVKEARPVVVISEAARDRLFGAAALGRALEIDGRRFQVVGVVRDVSRLRFISYADAWAPVTGTGPGKAAKAIVLARSAADIGRLKEELPLVLARWQSPDPREYPGAVAFLETSFERWAHGLFGGDREGAHVERFWAFLVMCTVVFMLLPAVNLVNLNVSRILERASEIGVRKSFGASARALVGQFLVENLLLTLLGGVLALALSALALHALAASGVFGVTRFAVNGRVFAVGLGLAAAFGLVSGVYPAWKMARMAPLAALRGVRR